MTANSTQRIPMTPELQAELAQVAASASERFAGRLFSNAVPEIVVRWLWETHGSFVGRVLLPTALMFAMSIVYLSLRAQSLGGAGSTLGSVLIESAAAALLFFGIFVAADVWRKRIARSPYIIRERGLFTVGGRFRAAVSQDTTRRSIRVATGEVRLDGVDSDERLAAIWEQLALREGEHDLEVDYTSNRYLLAVRRLSGEVLWRRTGYEPPDATSAPLAPVEMRSSWFARLWLFEMAALLFAVALGSLYAWATQPLYSPTAWVFMASSFGSLIVGLAALVVGVYRVFVATGDRAVDIMASDRS